MLLWWPIPSLGEFNALGDDGSPAPNPSKRVKRGSTDLKHGLTSPLHSLGVPRVLVCSIRK